MGMPGCPDLAFWTASMAIVRSVLTHSWSSSRDSRIRLLSGKSIVEGWLKRSPRYGRVREYSTERQPQMQSGVSAGSSVRMSTGLPTKAAEIHAIPSFESYALSLQEPPLDPVADSFAVGADLPLRVDDPVPGDIGRGLCHRLTNPARTRGLVVPSRDPTGWWDGTSDGAVRCDGAVRDLPDDVPDNAEETLPTGQCREPACANSPGGRSHWRSGPAPSNRPLHRGEPSREMNGRQT